MIRRALITSKYYRENRKSKMDKSIKRQKNIILKCEKSIKFSKVSNQRNLRGDRMENIKIRFAKFNDLTEINRLVERVFHQFVAPKYSEEGIEEFKRYIDIDLIRARFDDNHLIYVAEDLESKHIVGMLEIRNYDHISLFFVDKVYMGRNIGRKLSQFAFEKCIKDGKKTVTVNSSPNAIKIYKKLGFKVVGEEQSIKGIKSTPMEIEL